MINTQPLKGFRDFLPAAALKRQWLREKISQVFELWGYDPMETPTLEPLGLFSGQIGEDEKLFFQFKDPGGRDVALRYDQTVPTCRVVGEYAGQLVMPFKRYQIQPAFRAENPQKGRYREFLQCDADIFGIDSPMADAEAIALSLDIYRQLKFPIAQVKINDRSLLSNIPYPAIAAIDKLDKIGKDGVLAEMDKKGIPLPDAKAYLDQVLTLKPNETIRTILAYLKAYGFDESWYAFDPTIARSFSYSTGPIWEVKIPEFSGSVLGGERYDKLITQVSGQNIAGTGFGLGFDRTLEVAETLNLLPSRLTNTIMLVTVFSESELDTSITIASTLRAAGIASELYPSSNAKLDKQLKYADRKGIPYVIVVGPEEKARGVLKIKNLATRESEELTVEAVITKLKDN